MALEYWLWRQSPEVSRTVPIFGAVTPELQISVGLFMSNRPETLAIVRRAVRSVIEATPELRNHPGLERKIAERMVGVSLAAAELIDEERQLTNDIAKRAERKQYSDGPVLATAQAAGDIHGRTAVRSAAGVLRATRDAIDFPGFVTSLITGVFQAIQTSNIQQLQAFGDLLEAVNSTTEDFTTTQIAPARAIQWAVNRFSNFAVEDEGDEMMLVLRSESEMPDMEELKRALEATDTEVGTIDESELNETLIPLVQRKLARDRQSMLSTMVMMGLQRVVVDDGSLHASMRLQVDARSTAEQTEAEQFDSRVETEAGASFGMGGWGASAKMRASVGYVRSDEQFTREDISVSAGLRSSVDLRFRSLPLDVSRMADNRTLQQIQRNSMVPEREAELGSLISSAPPRSTRQPAFPAPAQPGARRQGSDVLEEARRAREAANRRERQGSGTEERGRGRGSSTGSREGAGRSSTSSGTREGAERSASRTGAGGSGEAPDAASTTTTRAVAERAGLDSYRGKHHGKFNPAQSDIQTRLADATGIRPSRNIVGSTLS